MSLAAFEEMIIDDGNMYTYNIGFVYHNMPEETQFDVRNYGELAEL